MDFRSSVTSWNNSTHDSTTTLHLAPHVFNQQYKFRNVGIGAAGIFLNLVVLPVICSNDDLSFYLKALFCCLACGDLAIMATAMSGGILSEHLSQDEFSCTLPQLTCCVFLSANINCMEMLAIAMERVLALRRPELFHRLGKSKVKVILVELGLLGVGVLLTLPVFISASRAVPEGHHFTPLAILSGQAVAMEAAVFFLSSLAVCASYSFLALTLMRTTSSHPCDRPGGDHSAVHTPSGREDSGTSTTRCSATRLEVANGAPASETTSGTSSSMECVSTGPVHITTRQMRRFRRATVHCFVLAVWFFIAYAPFGLYYLWVLLSHRDRTAESETTRITIISSFPLANSLVDPVLLLWRLFPFSKLGNHLREIAFHGAALVRELSNRLARAWAALRELCQRRGNRVENVGEDPHSTGTWARGGLRTIVVDGPSRSTRTIQVKEAPLRRKVRLKCAAVSGCSSVSWRIQRIEEQREDTAA